MTNLTDQRLFQLWEYHVSHGSLLIRSPNGPGIQNCIDIIFVGVEYIAMPRHLGAIELVDAAPAETSMLEEVLQKSLVPPTRAWALIGPKGRFLVVGVAVKIEEHEGDMFQSPFAGKSPRVG